MKAPPISAKGIEIKLKKASLAFLNAKYMDKKMIIRTTGKIIFNVLSLRIRLSY
jgi:hypothetical protein